MESPSQMAHRKSSPDGFGVRWIGPLLVCAVALGAVAAWAATVRYTPIHLFTQNESSNISAPLTPGPDGNFYGITFGGPIGSGDIFKLTPAGVFTILHSFPIGGSLAGGPIFGPLVLNTDGNFYGVGADKAEGGTSIFKITPTGVFTELHSFKDPRAPAGSTLPVGELAQNGDGLVYGTGIYGGTAESSGVFFSVAPDGAFKILHSFGKDGIDGGPGPITAGKDGNFYGLGGGTVYKMTPSGEATVLHKFTAAEGVNTWSAPVQTQEGTFYGVAAYGGAIVGTRLAAGTAFKFTTSGQFTLLHSFRDENSDGEYPIGGLVAGRDGNLYGTTSGGGFAQGGTIFQMTPAGVVTVLHSFDHNRGERTPKAGLTLGPDGNLYGVASLADAPATGAFFRLAPGGSGAMEADDTQVPVLIGPGNGTGASVAGGVLTYTDEQTHKVVKYKVQRPAFAAAVAGIPTQGPWIWVADDGQHGSMIAIDASGNVKVTPMGMQMIRTMLGAGR